jgi:von Willebrand factor A domain-containing protein 7
MPLHTPPGTRSSRARSPKHVSIRVLPPLVVAALIVAWNSHRVVAFWPWDLRVIVGSSIFDETHQSITKKAMTDLDSEFFSVTSLTQSMKDAIDEAIEANAGVDDNQKDGFWHFDGESFSNGRERVVALKAQVISQLQNSSDGAAARQSLGQALHTLQDFYSHSNWVELGHSSPNADITRSGPLLFAGSSERTCADNILLPGTSGTLVTTKLTSGYYHGENEVKPVPDPGKCNHGGLADGLFTDGINKDVTNISWAPHGFFHDSAASVAQEATKQLIRDIKNTPGVTLSQMKKLFGIELTLAIAIDTTGSMGSIIEAVKQQAISMVDSRIGTALEPTKYVLAPFNDPSVPAAMVFTEPAPFKSAISSLFASGGGDCPELAVGGVLQALSQAGTGGDLFMFTDASAKDSANVGAAVALASTKKITIHEPLFGSCSPIDPAYIRLAAATGGEYFVLSRSEAGSIARLSDFVVRPNKVSIAIVDDTLTGAPKSFQVPIDSTLRSATFVASGAVTMSIIRPNGTPVGAADPNVTSIALSAGRIVSVSTPDVGLWAVTLTGTGDVSFRVTGEGTADLESFRFLEPRGRPGHQGYYPISGQPLTGQRYLAGAVLSNSLSALNFEFRTSQGTVLESLLLPPGEGPLADTYYGNVTVPGGTFNLYVSGLDSSGATFQRVRAIAIQPQTIQLIKPAVDGLKAGVASTLIFSVKNFGARDTFRFVAIDNKGFVQSVNPSTFTLDTGVSVDVTVMLMPPRTAKEGDSTTLAVTVDSTTVPGVSNGATLVVPVTEGFETDREPPRLAISVTPTVLWPANHKMIKIDVNVTVADNKDPNPVVQLDDVASSENQDALGDGHTSPDIQVVNGAIMLRAERSGVGTGRVYTVRYKARDKSGNESFATATVTVPHDMGK